MNQSSVMTRAGRPGRRGVRVERQRRACPASIPWLTCVCAAVLSVAGAARAQSAGSSEPVAEPPTESTWSFGGFGTLGAVRQTGGDGWGFVRNSNQAGTTSRLSLTPDSRLGGQVNWSGGPRWEGALQAVLLNTPSGTPLAEAVQYAYLGYRPTASTRLRIGRTSPDLFLYADSRNIGYALPWVRPPVDFYGFVPLTAIDGLDVEQRWAGGDATWRARVTAGRVRGSAVDYQGGRVPFRGSPVVALGLTREDGGLLLKASYAMTRLSLDTGPQVDQLRQAVDQVAALPVRGLSDQLDPLRQNLWTGGRVSYLGLAAQYETGPWTLTAEGSRLWVPNSPLNALRGYLSAAWRHGPVTYFGLVSRVRPDHAAATADNLGASLAPIVGAAAAQQVQTLANYLVAAGGHYRYDQSTIGAGLRWDVTDSAALKLQLDRFDVRSQGGAGWRNYDGGASTGTLLSVAVDFVLGQ